MYCYRVPLQRPTCSLCVSIIHSGSSGSLSGVTHVSPFAHTPARLLTPPHLLPSSLRHTRQQRQRSNASPAPLHSSFVMCRQADRSQRPHFLPSDERVRITWSSTTDRKQSRILMMRKMPVEIDQKPCNQSAQVRQHSNEPLVRGRACDTSKCNCTRASLLGDWWSCN